MAGITFKHIKEKNIILLEATGLITGTDLINTIIKCNEECEITEDTFSIADFRYAIGRMTEQEIHEYRKYFVKLQDSRSNIRWHICALEKKTVEFANWIHRFLDNDLNIIVRVHDNEKDINEILSLLD